MKKLLVVGLVLCCAGIAYGDFISRETVLSGAGVEWVDEKIKINNNFEELWTVNFSDIASGTTVNAFVVDTGGSIVHANSGEIHATDFTLLAAAEGGEFNILNVGTIGTDGLQADDVTLTLGSADDNVHIVMDGAPDAEDSFSGLVIRDKNAGETIATWDLVYFDTTDSEWKKADSDTAGLWPAWGMSASPASVNDGNELIVLTKGIVRNDDWNWTVGAVLYLSTTAGGLTVTAPTTTNYGLQPVARALSADVIMVDINPIHGYGKVE